MKVINRASYIGVFLGAVWFFLMIYLGTNAPAVPDLDAGRIYEYNYHGTIVYLTFTEHILRFILLGMVVLTFFVLLIVKRHLKKKNKQPWPPDDLYGDN